MTSLVSKQMIFVQDLTTEMSKPPSKTTYVQNPQGLYDQLLTESNQRENLPVRLQCRKTR